jgi:hypothetical protein
MAISINGQSARLGETPVRIVYTREWPFGRVEFPQGGRFIREYGRSGPLPEALMEIERAGRPTAFIAPVAVPQSAAVPAYTAIGGVGFPYWSVPEMLEEARAERGPSPPYERAYMAGLGKSTGAFSRAGKRSPVL